MIASALHLHLLHHIRLIPETNLEFLLLLEEHPEADDGAIDK